MSNNAKGMVAIYVLKLSRGKYYVGLTRRNIDRVLDHIDGKGAAWTKKYPPSNSKPILSFREGLKESDEDRITLETMKRFGVKNVRGGSWCKVNMTQKEIRAIEVKISGRGKKPVAKKSTTKTKSSPKKAPTCSRCGREGHNRTKCYAKKTVDGVSITTKSWKYRPKNQPNKKKRKAKRIVEESPWLRRGLKPKKIPNDPTCPICKNKKWEGGRRTGKQRHCSTCGYVFLQR